jgi:hypothetical protein
LPLSQRSEIPSTLSVLTGVLTSIEEVAETEEKESGNLLLGGGSGNRREGKRSLLLGKRCSIWAVAILYTAV